VTRSLPRWVAEALCEERTGETTRVPTPERPRSTITVR
jgi:hypothetical protein